MRCAFLALWSAVCCCTCDVEAAPPASGLGYGAYQRTVEDLPDVQAALVENDGTVIAALGGGGVVRVAPDGKRSTLVAWWPAGQVAGARGLTWMGTGSFLLVDAPRAQVLHLMPDGERRVLADLTQLTIPPRPMGVCVLGERIFVVDGARPRVLVLDAAGTAVAQWDVPAPMDGLVPQLRGIAAGDGHVFVSDAANHRIVRLDPATGTVDLQWGDRGSVGDLLESPGGLWWDGAGVLVTDTLNHRVARFDAEGKPMDQWGRHAVRPREGEGRIHYPVTAATSPDGSLVVVAEPFERRVQIFGHQPPPDPNVPRMTPLPANEGIASHFSSEVAIDGNTLVVYEPESAVALVFDMRAEPPIHVTTIGHAGSGPGRFGQVSTQLVDEKGNRIYFVDPVRGVIMVCALRREGQTPRYDPFMGRLVTEVPLAPIAQFAAERTGGPGVVTPVDMRRTGSGGFVLLDALGARVIELDSSLRPVNAWGTGRGGARLVAPTQMAVLPQGEVVIVDATERALKRYTLADGRFLGAIALPEARRPWGIAMVPHAGGVRYAVSDTSGDALLIVDPTRSGTDGVVERVVATGQKPGEFWEPRAVEFQPGSSRLYVCDYGNHRLQSFSADGTWESTFGLGRSYVRPRDPNAAPAPSGGGGQGGQEHALDTRAQFPTAVRDVQGWFSLPSTDGRYVVRWRLQPDPVPLRDPFNLEVQVIDQRTGQPSEAQLRVDAAMPHHGHGMNVLPKHVQEGPGIWRVENMLFHMPGYWELYFDLIEGERLERAQAEVMLE